MGFGITALSWYWQILDLASECSALLYRCIWIILRFNFMVYTNLNISPKFLLYGIYLLCFSFPLNFLGLEFDIRSEGHYCVVSFHQLPSQHLHLVL